MSLSASLVKSFSGFIKTDMMAVVLGVRRGPELKVESKMKSKQINDALTGQCVEARHEDG
jgi:hypothetical protein